MVVGVLVVIVVGGIDVLAARDGVVVGVVVGVFEVLCVVEDGCLVVEVVFTVEDGC